MVLGWELGLALKGQAHEERRGYPWRLSQLCGEMEALGFPVDAFGALTHVFCAQGCAFTD